MYIFAKNNKNDMVSILMKATALILFIALPGTAFAQHQEMKLLAYNTVLGAVTASIGGLINKPANRDWKQVITGSIWQGAIGGGLRYSAKKVLYLVPKNSEPGYAFPAMLLQNAGNSIVENAAYNRPFLQSWHIDYGLARVDFDLGGLERPLKARLLPAAVVDAFIAAKNSRLNWSISLASGCLAFETKQQLIASSAKINVIAGLNFGRALVVNPEFSANRLQSYAHELVHYFQFNEYQICNTWFSRPVTLFAPRWLKKVANKYIYCDLPYSSIPYAIEGYHSLANYYDNFFEFEAERFSTNADVH